MNYKIKFILIIIIIAFGCDYIYTGVHENAHSEISRIYGCTNITMDLNYFVPSSLSNCAGETEIKTLSRYESQSNVEAIGYQLKVVMWVMVILTLILCMVIMRDD